MLECKTIFYKREIYMKIIMMFMITMLIFGCSAVQKGDYVKYTSDEYVFVKNNFIDQNIACLELGKMDADDINVKYCVGKNYASRPVEGFVFEHYYKHNNARFIGASIQFNAKKSIRFECSSETIEGRESGKEYINCMLPKTRFDMYGFINRLPEEIEGELRSSFSRQKVYKGVISTEGRKLLKKFYEEQALIQWKEKEL